MCSCCLAPTNLACQAHLLWIGGIPALVEYFHAFGKSIQTCFPVKAHLHFFANLRNQRSHNTRTGIGMYKLQTTAMDTAWIRQPWIPPNPSRPSWKTMLGNTEQPLMISPHSTEAILFLDNPN